MDGHTLCQAANLPRSNLFERLALLLSFRHRNHAIMGLLFQIDKWLLTRDDYRTERAVLAQVSNSRSAHVTTSPPM
jgi:hypothetical protein